MATIYDRIRELEDLIKTANALCHDYGTVTTKSGEVRTILQTISELSKERQFYSTKAIMDADLSHDANTMAEVVADPTPENNSIYIKTGASGSGQWDLCNLDRLNGVTEMEATVQAIEQNTDGFMSISDNKDTDGTEYIWGLTDKFNRVAMGVDTDGYLIAATRDMPPLSFINPDGLVYGIADKTGKIAFGVKYDGGVYTPPEKTGSPVVYSRTIDGTSQIFIADKFGETKLTNTGDNIKPQIVDDTIKFVSDRGKGYQIYTMNLDGSDLALESPEPLLHILGCGQSLSIGAYGTPALSTAAMFPTKAFMFNGGVRPHLDRSPSNDNSNMDPALLTSLVPLVEADTEHLGETLSSGLANALLSSGFDNKLLFSVHGLGGYEYELLKKSTVHFTNGIMEMKRGKYLADQQGYTYVASAVFIEHGEKDTFIGTTEADYESYLHEWQGDYSLYAKTISGQSSPVKMFLSQMSNLGYRPEYTTSPIPHAQRNAALNNNNITLVCPKYFLEYSDSAHLTGASYRLLGEYYSKAVKVTLSGFEWKPLSPISVTRADNIIDIIFNVPVEPLVFDSSFITDPGNQGFSYQDDSSSASIQNISIVGTDTVRITLDTTPTGTNKIIDYANYQDGIYAGPTSGARGCLRDSESQLSIHTNQPLYNWCIHFKESIE